jgi:hypothetical protein
MTVEEALRRVLLWQQTVLRDPERVMRGLDGPMSIACGLFMGPIWEDAIAVLSGESRSSLEAAFREQSS